MNPIALSANEQSLFDRLGVQIEAHSARFTKTLDWQDATIVFCAILNHVKHDEENWKFAMGDCVLEMEKNFGKKKTGAFVNDFSKLDKARKAALEVTGATLIQMQSLEHTLKMICTSTKIAPLRLKPEDFINLDPQKVHLTLGQMKDAIIKQDWFTPEFETQLTKFNQKRNQFVHRLWIEHSCDQESPGIPTMGEITKYIEAVHDLLLEAEEIKQAFLGLFGAIGIALQRDTPEKNEFLPYVPAFERSRKKKTSSAEREKG